MAGVMRVVAIDDDPSILTLVRLLLDRNGSIELVGQAEDGGPDTIELVRESQPDAVLLDLDMPTHHGQHALPQLIVAAPRTMVVVLSALPSEDRADDVFARGAFAYLEKSTLGLDLPTHLLELHSLFERALKGETVWSPSDPARVRR